MKIKYNLDEFNCSNSLFFINNFLEKLEVDITVWGQRVVTLPGYEGAFSLDKLATKIADISNQRFELGELMTTERVTGIGITHKIRHFYQVSDWKISQANCFTRLLNWLREYTFFSYITPRERVEQDLMEMYFSAYSQREFHREFGALKNKWVSRVYTGFLFLGKEKFIVVTPEAICENLKQKFYKKSEQAI